MGAKWKFASQADLDRFKENPEKYAPQYGGYCAYGVAQGNLVRTEPDQFTVLNGRLYLNYNADRSEEHTSEPQSLMRISYAGFCLQKKQPPSHNDHHTKNKQYYIQ